MPEKSVAELGAGSQPPPWGTRAGEARGGGQCLRGASASGCGLGWMRPHVPLSSSLLALLGLEALDIHPL